MTAFDTLTWLNPPPQHSVTNGTLAVTTGDRTDFWRETFYGFRRDDGHFLHGPVAGDFTAEVVVQGDYTALYDQAGLMMRLSESHWIKTGIEFTDGRPHVSVVVTKDTSDWSLVGVPLAPEGIGIRLTRHGAAVRVQYFSGPDGQWMPVRLASFPATERIDVGVMCCSPQRAGFCARFSGLVIGPPISRDLHG